MEGEISEQAGGNGWMDGWIDGLRDEALQESGLI
jgi:hypothetical protein